MRILHYSLGFPPYRTGGLTKFCVDLMHQQVAQGNAVALLWPGEMKIINKCVAVKDRGYVEKIQSFEMINPLPISYDEGISDIDRFIEYGATNEYEAFLQRYQPEVIHIHTLMGLHQSFVDCAKQLGIRLVFTAHDYFPICSKVTLLKNGEVCKDSKVCENCDDCNQNALSLRKIYLLQSPLYRAIKDFSLTKKARKHHRDNTLNQTNTTNSDKSFSGCADDYQRLRAYYFAMLKKMDIIHYNSTLTKHVYEEHFALPKSVIIPITHADIRDMRKKKEFSFPLQLTYLGTQSSAKGYFLLKGVLDKLATQKQNFKLNVFFKPSEKAPYMVVNSRYSYDQLENILEKSDLVIVPSCWYETFGYTALEALSFGVPVMISGNVGAKDIVPFGGGIIIEQMSEESLFQALLEVTPKKLYEMNENILSAVGILQLPEMAQTIFDGCYCG